MSRISPQRSWVLFISTSLWGFVSKYFLLSPPPVKPGAEWEKDCVCQISVCLHTEKVCVCYQGSTSLLLNTFFPTHITKCACFIGSGATFVTIIKPICGNLVYTGRGSTLPFYNRCLLTLLVPNLLLVAPVSVNIHHLFTCDYLLCWRSCFSSQTVCRSSWGHCGVIRG